jgi:DNA-binding MarR family transcriptional regulator
MGGAERLPAAAAVDSGTSNAMDNAANAGGAGASADELDLILRGSRALVAVAARALSPINDVISLSQWRVLVIVTEYEAVSLSQVAVSLGVHASTATRICDRLVAAGLVSRRDDPSDRRYLALTVTAKGRRLVDRVAAARRRELQQILGRLSAPQRRRMVEAFADFAAAMGDQPSDTVWAALAELS